MGSSPTEGTMTKTELVTDPVEKQRGLQAKPVNRNIIDGIDFDLTDVEAIERILLYAYGPEGIGKTFSSKNKYPFSILNLGV